MPQMQGFESYEQWAAAILPELRRFLSGQKEVPPQGPFAEAWLGYALYYHDRLLSLEEVIESADAVNHGIPAVEAVAWAFQSLSKRGWLALQAEKFGLTAEGRRAINTIIVQDSVHRLRDWISENPPARKITAKEVFLSLGKNSVKRR